MLGSIASRLKKRLFDLRARAIFRTPPAPVDGSADFIVLSQVYPPDVTMYVVAVKSFSRFVIPGAYVVIDDGLSAVDRQVIARNVAGVRFIPISSVALGDCPSGGCWERLCGIASLNGDAYVIQLDADTFTLQKPDEVLACLGDNRSFTLGTYKGRELVSLQAASEYAGSIDSRHVQIMGETAFASYPGKEQYRYVRGCAGFAGFARGTASLSEISRFSETMSGLVGRSKWAEWGSEQVTSNFFIANSESPVILPVERYPFMSEQVDEHSCKLIHFYGAARFSRGLYPKVAKRLAQSLTPDSVGRIKQ